MRILITGETNYLRDRNNNEYQMLQYFAEKNEDIRLILDSELTKNHILEFKPDIVFSVNCGKLMDERLIDFLPPKIPLCLVLDDLFHFDNVSSLIPERCNVIVFMVKWKILQEQYQRKFPNKIIKNFASRYVNTDIYTLHPEEKKKYDVLFYGTDNVTVGVPLNDIDKQYFDEKWMERNNTNIIPQTFNFYPLRKRLRDLFLKNSNKYNVNIFEPHGSYPTYPKGVKYITGIELSKIISQSYLTICTSSRSDTLLKKYLEISSSGSILLGNIPSDYKDFFENWVVKVDENMTDEEILCIVDKALSEKESLLKKSREFAHIVHKYHNYDCAYFDFINMANEIMKEYRLI